MNSTKPAVVLLLVMLAAALSEPAQAQDQSGSSDFSGLYLGGAIGGGWGESNFNQTVNNGTWTDYFIGGARTGDKFDIDGVLGGGFVGWNHQIDQFVGGFEVSVLGSDVDDRFNSRTSSMDDVIETDVRLLVSAVARIGFALDNLLLYAKGGYTGGEVDFAVSDTMGVAPGSAGTWSKSEWHDGYTIGAGFDLMLTESILIGAEYNFIDLGSANHRATDSNGAPLAYRTKQEIHAVMARISFKFNVLNGN